MTPELRERAGSMRQRVLDRLNRAPLNAADVAQIDEAVTRALLVRDGMLEDDHDVDLLHPARTVLILLDDACVSDPQLLSAGALLESVRPELRAEVGDGAGGAREDGRRSTGGGGLLGTPGDVLAGTLPTPCDVEAGELLEALLALHDKELDVVLAERLDHARHLHMRPRSVWMAGLAIEEAVYLPLAQRRGGLVGRRYERWHRAFTARRARSE